MSEVFDLSGQVAVVTGALGLLGRQHCEALCEAGAHLVVTDLSAAACADLAETLSRQSGRKHLGVGADLTEAAEVEGLRARILETFGRVDVLVNNAAINDKVEGTHSADQVSRFEHYPLDVFRNVIDVSVTSAFLCCQQLCPTMAEQGRGSVINVASTYALVAPDQRLYQKPDGSQDFFKSAAYPTAKAAMLGFTRFLASYYGSRGVRANSLCPGGVENGQDAEFIQRYARRTPVGRMARPSEYQGALLFLASQASAYMTGATLVMDGGYTAW